MLASTLQVALGGAVGASARFLIGAGMARGFGSTGFPLAILMVNVAGSFLMGVLFVLLGRWGLTHLSPLLLTGLLGGFTTFSAFSLETVTLWERGLAGQAVLYVALSVILSILALAGGLWLGRGIA